MNIYVTFGATVLALTAIATSCTTVASERSRGANIYRVGVAGGG